MDLLKRIDKMIPEEVVSGDIAQNTAKGSVDVVGGECPEGEYYCPKRKKCMPKTDETTTVSGVVGSGQTRAVGTKDKYISVVRRNPRPLKFSELTGAYLPPEEDTEEDVPGEPEEVDEGLFSGNKLKKYFEKAKKSWHGLDMEMKGKEIRIFAGTERIVDAVYDWAKDKLPITFKVSKSQGIVTIKV